MHTSNDRPESYVYFTITGNERYRFDPRAVTERTGLTPSASLRRGDVRRLGTPPVPGDRWSFASPSPHTESLASQADALFSELRRVWKPLCDVVGETFPRDQATDPESDPGPTLQYVVHDFANDSCLRRRHVADAAEMGMRIDCDAYLRVEQRFIEGRCLNCGVPSPATFSDIAHRMGAYVSTTECKMQLWIDDVDPAFASDHFGVSAEWDERGTDSNDVRVAYIFATRRLLFASNLVPLPEGDEWPTIDAWIASFTDRLSTFPLPTNAARTFVLSITNRGAGGGFHLEPQSVRRIAALDADVRFRLDTQPAQQFSILGQCRSCSFNVLTNESER